MGLFPMSYLVHCLLFHLLLLRHFPISSYASSSVLPLCNHDDGSALLQFKDSFSLNTSLSEDLWYYCSPSSSSKTWSWINGTDCCQWDGVTCDALSGHVTGLDLSCCNLEGKFHPNSTLFHLTHLQQLNLAFNDFSGSAMHPGFGDLVSLTHLNLKDSGFDGDIPSTISHLSKLISLDLSYILYSTYSIWRLRFDPSTWNKLILNATNLAELFLDEVDMSSMKEGSLSLLMNLSSSLVYLNMGATRLQGNLSTEILCLPNLQQLTLSFNEDLRGELPKSNWSAPLKFLDLYLTAFSGEIPSSIGHLKSLERLLFRDCQFHGLLPLSLGNLTQLIELDLTSTALSGEIPSSIGHLRSLELLGLGGCQFHGLLPLPLWNLTQIIYLELYSNAFSGEIPSSIGHLRSLKGLLLGDCQFHGLLPLSLWNLTQLRVLELSSSAFSEEIPSSIGHLRSLEILRLNGCQFHGLLPLSLWNLTQLTLLDLSGNMLNGEIPDIFDKFTKLEHLILSYNNNIHGKFPNSIFELKNLRTLLLSSTNLSGIVNFHQFLKLENLKGLDLSHNGFLFFNIDNNSVDNTLPNLVNLVALDLSHNKIHGKIPKWFKDNLLHTWKMIQTIDLSFNKLQGDLPILPYGIEFFSVSNNNLTGEIPSTLCNATSLQILILSHNNLTGMIPQCLGNFPSLVVLDLQMNNLQGSIPENISKYNAFETLKFNGNLLEGPLPQSLGQCTKLEVLDLGDNNIKDVFPNWLEALQELQVLILRANKFRGIITSFRTMHPFPKLRIFDVSNNNFSGPLPTLYFKKFEGMMNVNDQPGLEYMNSYYMKINQGVSYNDSIVVIMKGQSRELVRILTTFTTIDLSNNMFQGEIPQAIGQLNSLKGLNLSHNGVSGNIPHSLGNLRNLEWLDLSWNQLKGEVPMTLSNLNFLQVLNLSQNQLEGTIPTGEQFNTFQNDSYGGNPMLCGFPLSKSCSNDEQPPSTFQNEESGFGWKCVALGYACGVVFGMLLGCGFLFSGKPLCLARLVGVPNRRTRRAIRRAHANH